MLYLILIWKVIHSFKVLILFRYFRCLLTIRLIISLSLRELSFSIWQLSLCRHSSSSANFVYYLGWPHPSEFVVNYLGRPHLGHPVLVYFWICISSTVPCPKSLIRVGRWNQCLIFHHLWDRQLWRKGELWVCPLLWRVFRKFRICITRTRSRCLILILLVFGVRFQLYFYRVSWILVSKCMTRPRRCRLDISWVNFVVLRWHVRKACLW